MNYFRVIDANINRVSEGLRVIEEIFRFIYNDENAFQQLKDIRHNIRKIVQQIPIISQRDSFIDVGKKSFSKSEKDRGTIENIFDANIKRVQESLRVLEEFFKLENKTISFFFKEIRFDIYKLEQSLKSVKFKFRKILNENRITLYAIIDTRFSDKDYITLCNELLDGGIKIIQLREKELKDRELFYTAKQLSDLCREKDAIFIVNDRIDVAYLVDADGVHLGQDDIEINEAKKILGINKIYGLSTHNFSQVEKAVSIRPDYIGFGPIFPTKSKEKPDPVVGVDNLKKIKKIFSNLPVVAIGGINEENILMVRDCSPEMICIMSGIISKEDVKKEVVKYKRMLI